METIDIFMLVLYLILQIIIGGIIFMGIRKFFRVLTKKDPMIRIPQLFILIVGIVGLSYFLVLNTLRLIDKY